MYVGVVHVFLVIGVFSDKLYGEEKPNLCNDAKAFNRHALVRAMVPVFEVLEVVGVAPTPRTSKQPRRRFSSVTNWARKPSTETTKML